MKTKDNKELIKLISIIVVFFIFILLGISSALSLSTVREDSFRTEANKVLTAAKEAVEENKKVTNDNKSCKINKDRYCYSVDYLEDLKLYKGNNENNFIGKVVYDKSNNSYELYFKKNDEFKIIAGSSSDYTKSGTLSVNEWKEEHSLCNCEEITKEDKQDY